VDDPGAPDRLLQSRPHVRVELLQSVGEGLRRHPDLLQLHTVEFLRVLDQRRRAAMTHVLTDRPHLLQGGRHVELGAGQQVAQRGALGKGIATQVDSSQKVRSQHRAILADRNRRPVVCITD
jgi:hypothetical protein